MLTNAHLELSWAAGFFDGEGTTSSDSRSYCYPRLSLGQAGDGEGPPITLLRFHAAVRGVGGIERRRDVEDRRPMWCWRAYTHEQSQAVLAMLWPYLSEPKRAQARRAFERFSARTSSVHQRRQGKDGRCLQCETVMRRSPRKGLYCPGCEARWRRANPEKVREYARRYRAKKAASA